MEKMHGCEEIKTRRTRKGGLVSRGHAAARCQENDTIIAMSDACFRDVSRRSETNEKIDLMMIQE